MKNIFLDELPLNIKAKVVRVVPKSKIRKRLMDMGMVPGTQIIIEGKAPLGDPIKVRVRGYKLTLRKKEAQDILVEKVC
ncbi:ferrous iron transport protein A [Haloimpatiens sp. FM7330]|uniref:FeoA family protein n=1 Tax=Haloimpatiens sp. FM7330 TaxID=3298610 RepID=UPI00364100C1